MSRRKTSALRKEQQVQTYQDPRTMQTFYKKHKSENVLEFNPQQTHRRIELVPKTRNQERYILALNDESTDVVVATGPAGTGKTYLALLAAIRAMRSGECDRLVLTRPAVAIEDEKHGFLPGDLNSKLEPWVKPMIDVIYYH